MSRPIAWKNEGNMSLPHAMAAGEQCPREEPWMKGTIIEEAEGIRNFAKAGLRI